MVQKLWRFRLLVRRNLRLRLTLIVLVSALLAMVGAVLFVSYSAETVIRQQNERSLQLINASVKANTSTWLDLNLKALANLLKSTAVIEGQASEQSSILAAMAETYPHLYLISTTNSQGLNLARSDGKPATDYGDRAWFKAAMAGHPLTYETLIGKTSGAPALVVSMPIKSGGGQIRGVGMFASHLTALAAEIDAHPIGETGFAYIVDAQNRVLAHPDPSYTSEMRDMSHYPPVVALRSQGAGPVVFSDEAGVTWDGYVSQLPNGWGVITQQQELEASSALRHFQQTMWGAISGVTLLLVGVLWVTMRQVLGPIDRLTQAASSMAKGDLSVELRLNSEDEVGRLAAAFRQMIENLQEITCITRDVAQGDLTISVSPKSERDMLGLAFGRMIENFRQLIHQVAQSAYAVGSASVQLAASAEQTGQVTAMISMASQEQSEQVGQAQLIAQQMAEVVEQVSQSINQGVSGAVQAAQIAREGAGQVEASLVGMSGIKAKVGVSAQRVREMGEYSSQVGMIVETIDDIATQTNLLALNAAIEAARAEGQAHRLVEYLLDQQMITQARLLAEMLVCSQGQVRPPRYWGDLAQRAGIDNICITDADGVVVFSDQNSLLGFRFSDEPAEQTYPFRQLLRQRNGVYCQATQPRSVDHQLFKYVGVSRQDEPGLVQVGFRADTLGKFRLQVGGFAVVATEVRRLAERSGQATKEIAGLIKNMQRTIAEAVGAMEEGTQEMEIGMHRASEAGQALHNILQAVEGVSRQMETMATSTQQITTSANILTEAMDAISAVVEVNAAATEEMSEQALEMNDSAQALQAMAKALGDTVGRFKLSETDSNSAPFRSVPVEAQPVDQLPLEPLLIGGNGCS